MINQIETTHFTEAFLLLLDETFDNTHSIYLDKDTSLFDTLQTITAQEASQPVSASCASIAAHVAHITFYLRLTIRVANGERPQVDWGEIWRTVRDVTPEEWTASQHELRDAYNDIIVLAKNTTWQNTQEIAGAFGVLAHTAYHLGEIRQALCTLKPNR